MAYEEIMSDEYIELLEKKIDDQSELLMAMYVQLSRILDALYVIAGKEEGPKLDQLHSAGGLLSSDPYLIAKDENETNG
jgi:hypothetical protein